MTKTDPIRARLAALKTTPTPELKQQWRDLFESEPPAFNRRYLESRLAYRIQELAYGGLKPETVKRLEALGEQLDGGNITLRRIRADLKPIAGTRLVREWQGIEQTVTVLAEGYETPGKSFKSDCGYFRRSVCSGCCVAVTIVRFRFCNWFEYRMGIVGLFRPVVWRDPAGEQPGRMVMYAYVTISAAALEARQTETTEPGWHPHNNGLWGCQ